MERCDVCSAVLPDGAKECPDCTHQGMGPADSGTDASSTGYADDNRNDDATSSDEKAIEVTDSVVEGGIGNTVTGPSACSRRNDDEWGEVEDLVETYEQWKEIKDREARNEARREADLEHLEERAKLELERERLALEERRATIESERREGRSQASLAALLLEADDRATVEALRSLDTTERGEDTPSPDDGTVEAVQALEALAAVERAAATNQPDLSELYVSLEKVVRLLGEFDEDLGDDIEEYLELQRVLTEGSISETELTNDERDELRDLCERGREAILTDIGGTQ